ncbi:MAG TPA: heterocyst frequency control protein PatD [Leptolyngbyaceae cyanobacterium]
MLQLSHRQGYQEFQQALEHMRKRAAATELDEVALQENFQDVQQLFQSKIASLSVNDLLPDYESRWQSIQTEIYKQMRLLGTDVMLLQASRSSATSHTRQAGLCDRINTLIHYCEALLQL